MFLNAECNCSVCDHSPRTRHPRSEVKWALESITTNKASGGDGIPVELFQILKDDAVKVLYSICQQIWKTQQWPQDWKRSVFIPIPRKDKAKECPNCHTIALISHASKVMLKILQASAVKKSTNNKCWRGCGEKGKPLTLLVGMQLVQAL